MKAEELKDKLKELADKYELDRKAIQKEYALSNNPHKVGDYVKDHIGWLLIERINWGVPYLGEPCCVYHGLRVTGKFEPAKKQSDSPVWQTNIEEFKVA